MVTIALAALAGLALVLAVTAQLILPSVAANRLSDELSVHGTVQSVKVSAFPALKLLWGEADSVLIRMGELHTAVAQSGDLLAKANETANLEVLIGAASVGPLTLHDLRLRAAAGELHGQASVTEAELNAALPPGLGVEPIASGDGRLLLRGSASLFGFGISADALLSAQDGKLVIEPARLPLGGLARLTVYADPRIAITGVGVSSNPGGFTFTADGRLRG